MLKPETEENSTVLYPFNIIIYSRANCWMTLFAAVVGRTVDDAPFLCPFSWSFDSLIHIWSLLGGFFLQLFISNNLNISFSF